MTKHMNTIDTAAASKIIDSMDYGWMAKTKQAGAEWAKLVEQCGCSYNMRDSVITVVAHCTPMNDEEYDATSRIVRRLIGACPQAGAASTWGNDGIGAMIAKERGCIEMHKGSVAKRFAAGLN